MTDQDDAAIDRALRRDALAWLLLVLASPVAAVVLIATVFFTEGNGLGAGTFALATLPVLLLGIPRAIARPERRIVMILTGLFAFDLAYGAWRVTRVAPDPGLAFCVDGACGATPPFLARLIREDETAYSGIPLSDALGWLSDPERVTAVPATHRVYDELAGLRGGRPGVNGLFLSSNADRVEELVSMPPGDGKVPALVFLHGFGGEITPCVSIVARSPIGQRYAIVAPALDLSGYWWTRDGREVLERTLATLPERIDRDRLWLVGLSNGAIGATHLGTDARFRGVILIVGADAPRDGERFPGPVLAIAGRDDPRFPIEGIRGAAERFRWAGTDVTLEERAGDHFVLFTDPEGVTGTMASWLARWDR
jgi:pimeloyl-ACP methyl ester carboxylesterase